MNWMIGAGVFLCGGALIGISITLNRLVDSIGVVCQ